MDGMSIAKVVFNPVHTEGGLVYSTNITRCCYRCILSHVSTSSSSLVQSSKMSNLVLMMEHANFPYSSIRFGFSIA
jgi:hypothetical protein